MEQQIPARTLLHRGQSLHLHAAAGTTFIAAHGSVRLCCTPDWRSEHLAPETFLLQEGEAHAVQHPGWIIVAAQDTAELRCIPAPKRTGFLYEPLIRLLCAVKRHGIL